MVVTLKSGNGAELSMPPRYWSFFLSLSETCEWRPQGTKKPRGYGFFSKWNGSYELHEGQTVTLQDALEFSNGLNRCYYSKKCFEIMKMVNENIEAQVQKSTKMVIPEEMKIQVTEDLRELLGKLMAFSHQGEFSIF